MTSAGALMCTKEDCPTHVSTLSVASDLVEAQGVARKPRNVVRCGRCWVAEYCCADCYESDSLRHATSCATIPKLPYWVVVACKTYGIHVPFESAMCDFCAADDMHVSMHVCENCHSALCCEACWTREHGHVPPHDDLSDVLRIVSRVEYIYNHIKTKQQTAINSTIDANEDFRSVEEKLSEPLRPDRRQLPLHRLAVMRLVLDVLNVNVYSAAYIVEELRHVLDSLLPVERRNTISAWVRPYWWLSENEALLVSDHFRSDILMRTEIGNVNSELRTQFWRQCDERITDIERALVYVHLLMRYIETYASTLLTSVCLEAIKWYRGYVKHAEVMLNMYKRRTDVVNWVSAGPIFDCDIVKHMSMVIQLLRRRIYVLDALHAVCVGEECGQDVMNGEDDDRVKKLLIEPTVLLFENILGNNGHPLYGSTLSQHSPDGKPVYLLMRLNGTLDRRNTIEASSSIRSTAPDSDEDLSMSLPQDILDIISDVMTDECGTLPSESEHAGIVPPDAFKTIVQDTRVYGTILDDKLKTKCSKDLFLQPFSSDYNGVIEDAKHANVVISERMQYIIGMLTTQGMPMYATRDTIVWRNVESVNSVHNETVETAIIRFDTDPNTYSSTTLACFNVDLRSKECGTITSVLVNDIDVIREVRRSVFWLALHDEPDPPFPIKLLLGAVSNGVQRCVECLRPLDRDYNLSEDLELGLHTARSASGVKLVSNPFKVAQTCVLCDTRGVSATRLSCSKTAWWWLGTTGGGAFTTEIAKDVFEHVDATHHAAINADIDNLQVASVLQDFNGMLEVMRAHLAKCYVPTIYCRKAIDNNLIQDASVAEKQDDEPVQRIIVTDAVFRGEIKQDGPATTTQLADFIKPLDKDSDLFQVFVELQKSIAVFLSNPYMSNTKTPTDNLFTRAESFVGKLIGLRG